MTPSDRFGKVLQYFVGAVALGMLFSTIGYPFFISWDIEQGWFLQNPSSLEGNLLVFASILIGVAVIQAQNLNRMKDILRAMRTRKSGGLSGALDSTRFVSLMEKLSEDPESSKDLKSILREALTVIEEFRHDTAKVSEDLAKTMEVYEFLLRGFWLLSLAIIVVILTLAFAVLVGSPLSSLAAFMLSTGWWTTIWLILIGWGCLATVAWRSYMFDQ
jgi:ABC-type multidrug transport system fused ATPase/permease subunit